MTKHQAVQLGFVAFWAACATSSLVNGDFWWLPVELGFLVYSIFNVGVEP